MSGAKDLACDLLYHPKDEKYAEHIRMFQGCPTVALTRGGRVYLGWYAGGTTEPHMDNYNWLTYSDDGGKTLSAPLLVIPSSKKRLVHALDIQLWVDPNGCLHVFWVQNDVKPIPEVLPERSPWKPFAVADGYFFDDCVHACWEIVCQDPDAEMPVFSAPRRLDQGFLRCKPLVLADGTWINFNYDQTNRQYGYSVSHDGGKTYERRYGAQKLETTFDEAMAYQMRDGSIRMLARTRLGQLAQAYSHDGGKSWTETQLSGIDSPNTRFFVARTPSGRILLINNDDCKTRKNMTVYLSEDDGETWRYKACIDTRNGVSYPDVDFYGDRIYLIYDRERTGAKEILLTSFTEEDVIGGTVPAPWVISKP